MSEPADERGTARRRRVRPVTWLALVVTLVTLAAGGVGWLRYRGSHEWAARRLVEDPDRYVEVKRMTYGASSGQFEPPPTISRPVGGITDRLASGGVEAALAMRELSRDLPSDHPGRRGLLAVAYLQIQYTRVSRTGRIGPTLDELVIPLVAESLPAADETTAVLARAIVFELVARGEALPEDSERRRALEDLAVRAGVWIR